MAEDSNTSNAPKERIGQGLVRLGVLTENQVSEVLIQQRTESGVDRLFGEIAVELGFCDDETINSILDADADAATAPYQRCPSGTPATRFRRPDRTPVESGPVPGRRTPAPAG